MNISLEVIATLLGILSIVAGGVSWYRSSVQKNYAAERDFAHIRRNYEQAQQALNSLQEDNDRVREILIEMKSLMLAMSNRMEGIAARLDSSTGGWSRRNEG